MGAREVKQFLSHHALNKNVASATQNQTLSAIVFLYREVLSSPLKWMEIWSARSGLSAYRRSMYEDFARIVAVALRRSSLLE